MSLVRIIGPLLAGTLAYSKRGHNGLGFAGSGGRFGSSLRSGPSLSVLLS